MNGFLTPDNPHNLFLPQLEKVISDLGLPFTHKDNFELIQSQTGNDINISPTTLYKLTTGGSVGQNTQNKLAELYSDVRELYQTTPPTIALIQRSLKVRSNATDWIYAIDGFNQKRKNNVWPDITHFLANRCMQDITFFEALKKVNGQDDQITIYMDFLKEHTLIPLRYILAYHGFMKQHFAQEGTAIEQIEIIDSLLFVFHLRVDFLFAALASFERDLDLPHFQLNPGYIPHCRGGETIKYYIQANHSGTKGYRNLFGCFLHWIIENMPKPDGNKLTWSELATFIPVPENTSSVETIEKRQYDELRKWRKARTNRNRPGGKKLAAFIAAIFNTDDGQADVVYLLLKLFMLLDELVIEWEYKISQINAEYNFSSKINSKELICSVLLHYNEHWLNSGEQPTSPTTIWDK